VLADCQAIGTLAPTPVRRRPTADSRPAESHIFGKTNTSRLAEVVRLFSLA
jgi:hypothetical protein